MSSEVSGVKVFGDRIQKFGSSNNRSFNKGDSRSSSCSSNNNNVIKDLIRIVTMTVIMTEVSKDRSVVGRIMSDRNRLIKGTIIMTLVIMIKIQKETGGHKSGAVLEMMNIKATAETTAATTTTTTTTTMTVITAETITTSMITIDKTAATIIDRKVEQVAIVSFVSMMRSSFKSASKLDLFENLATLKFVNFCQTFIRNKLQWSVGQFVCKLLSIRPICNAR